MQYNYVNQASLIVQVCNFLGGIFIFMHLEI